jgi:hypothetical protein
MYKVGIIGAVLIMSGCSSVEFRQEKDMCESTWMSKIPPVYEQEMYNKSQTRQVSTGQTYCTGYGYSLNCRTRMRTEYYTVPAIRTVDKNEYQRDAEIKSCTRIKCIQRMGNARCE